MDINNVANKLIKTTNYTSSNTTKKVDSENKESNTPEKSQGTIQTLGTDTFVKSTETDAVNQSYKPIKKKLTTEEVQALKDEQDNIKADLIKKFIHQTIKNQNKLLGKSYESEDNVMTKESKDLLINIFGSLENAYPQIDTTPEGALKAVSEDGAYSVNAVADRIMKMATAIAGDDQNKLQEMRDAVEEGFKQAGQVFKDATDSDLPQISKDTYTEIMSRFDKLQGKTTAE